MTQSVEKVAVSVLLVERPLIERAAGMPEQAMVDRSLESLGSLLGMRSPPAFRRWISPAAR